MGLPGLEPRENALQLLHRLVLFPDAGLQQVSGGGNGRRLNGFLGLSLNDRTILFLVISIDKTVSVG